MDFQRLAKAMQNSERLPLTEEEVGSLKVDQMIKKNPEKEEISNPNENTQKDLPKTPRRSARLKAKKDPICKLGCCVSLLALLLLTGQTTAFTPPHLDRVSHFQTNISERAEIYQVRNPTEQNNIFSQAPLSSNPPGLTTFNTSP